MNKSLKPIITLCLLLKLTLSISQTNLILNPSFEAGSPPSGFFESDGSTQITRATYWGTGFCIEYAFDANTSKTEGEKITHAYSSISTPDLFDRNTVQAGSPSDLRGTVVPNKVLFRNYHIGTSPNSLDEKWGQNRFAGIVNEVSSSSGKESEVLAGTLRSDIPLEAGCRYKIRFWAARMKSDVTKLPYTTANPQIEVLLRKRGTRETKGILITGQLNSEGWIMFEDWFSLCPADIEKGFDNIEFKNVTVPFFDGSKFQKFDGVFIDSVSLCKSGGGYTPTSGYIFPDNITQNINTTWSGKTVEISKIYTLNSNLTINGNSLIKLMKDAKIVVQSGKILTITDSELSGACGMWEGIVVQAGGKLVFTNNKIFDAHIGIKITGTTSEFLIADNTFEANVVHISLDNAKTIGTSNSITGNWLAHLKPLKDPCYYVDGNQRIGIVGVNCSNEVKVGNNSLGSTKQNKFEKGTFGAYLTNSNFEFQNSYFTKITFYSIHIIEKNKTAPLNAVEVYNCKFDFCQRGVNVNNNTNLYVMNSTFEDISHYGISWQNNKKEGLILQVGQEVEGSWNNFTRIAGTAIYCYNNSHINTSSNLPTNTILIYYNKIRFSPIGDTRGTVGVGIYVSEPTINSLRQFLILDITQNVIDNVRAGIKVENVLGVTNKLAESFPRGRPELFISKIPSTSPITEYEIIRKNNIIYYGWTADASGIKVSNSRGMHITHNRNFHTRPWEFQNKGIWLDNSQNSQVVYNYSKNGTGFLSNMIMLESNYFCDTFNTNFIGIQLLKNVLRQPFIPHGRGTKISGSGSSAIYRENARDNVYQTPHKQGFDIDVNSTVCRSVLWDLSTTQMGIKIDKRKAIASWPLLASGFDIRRPSNRQESCTIIVDTTNVGANQDSMNLSGIDLTQTNPVLKFNEDYYRESKFILDSVALIGTVNSNIAKLVQAEKWYFLNQDSRADSVLATLTPANTFQRDYKNALVMLIETLDTNFVEFDSSQLDTLKYIAQKRNYNGAAPVYVARAMYFNATNILFGDDDDYQLTIRGVFSDSLFCEPDTTLRIEMALVDETNTILNNGVDTMLNSFMGIHDGKVEFNPYILAKFDTTKLIRFTQWQTANYAVNSSPLKTIGEWLRQPEWNMQLSQVKATLLAEGISVPSLPDDLTADDGGGFDYELSTVANNSLLKKKNGILPIWSKTYNGYKNQTDLATALGIDELKNIFVLNKITINSVEGLEIVQYNVSGEKIWNYIMFDGVNDISPIGLQPIGYGGVEITCLKTVGVETTLQHYRIMRCEDIWSNHANNHLYKRETKNNHKQNETPLCTIYPNPSNGEVFVKIENVNEPCKLEIYSLQGQKIHEVDVLQGLSIVDMKDKLPKGAIYIAKIVTKSGKFVDAKRLLIK